MVMADSRIVDIKKLSKAFGKNVVLNGVDVHVEHAENLVVFGRSGTGKSVLLKCIIGLMQPDSGDISVLDKDLLSLNTTELNELRKSIGFLFQGGALYDSMTVSENLSFPLIRNFKFSNSELKDKVEEALEMVSLSDAIDKMPSELSGGMRKRIALARAIITQPTLMLYDEPTTGLDPITTKEISELILELQQNLNMTSIAVTHDLICAEIISDRVIFLREGEVKYEGLIEELVKSDDPFLVKFFSSTLN